MKRTNTAVFQDFINHLENDLKLFPVQVADKTSIQDCKYHQIVVAEIALAIADQIGSIDDLIKLRSVITQKQKFMHYSYKPQAQYEIKSQDISVGEEKKIRTNIRSTQFTDTNAAFYTSVITSALHHLFDARAKDFASPTYKSCLTLPNTSGENYETLKKNFLASRCRYNPKQEMEHHIDFLNTYEVIQSDLLQLQQLNTKYAVNSRAIITLSLITKLPLPTQEIKNNKSTQIDIEEKKSLLRTCPPKMISAAIRKRIQFEHAFLLFELLLHRWCKILRPNPETDRPYEKTIFIKFYSIINQELLRLLSHVCIAEDIKRIQELLTDTFEKFSLIKEQDKKESSSIKEWNKKFLAPKVLQSLTKFKDPHDCLIHEFILTQTYPKILADHKALELNQVEKAIQLIINTPIHELSDLELTALESSQIFEVFVQVILRTITIGDLSKIYYCLEKITTIKDFSENELIANYPSIALMFAAFMDNSDTINILMRDNKLQQDLCKDYTLSVMETKDESELDDFDETAMTQVSTHESKKLILLYLKNNKWWACGYNPIRKEAICFRLENFNDNSSELPKITLISSIITKLDIPNPLQIAWAIAQQKQHLAASVSLLSNEGEMPAPKSKSKTSSRASSKTPSRATSRRSSINKLVESFREREHSPGSLGSSEDFKTEIRVPYLRKSSRPSSKTPSPSLTTRQISTENRLQALRERDFENKSRNIPIETKIENYETSSQHSSTSSSESPSASPSASPQTTARRASFPQTIEGTLELEKEDTIKELPRSLEDKPERSPSLVVIHINTDIEEKIEKIGARASEIEIINLLLNIARQQDHKNFDRLVDIVFANYPSLNQETSRDFIFGNIAQEKIYREQWAIAYLALHLSTQHENDKIAINFLGQKLNQYLGKCTQNSNISLTSSQQTKITKAWEQFSFIKFNEAFSDAQNLSSAQLAVLYGRHLKDFIASPRLLAKLSINKLENARGDGLHKGNNMMYHIIKAKRGSVSPVIAQYWSRGSLSFAYSELMGKRSRLWRRYPPKPTVIKKKIAEEEDIEEKDNSCFSCFRKT